MGLTFAGQFLILQDLAKVEMTQIQYRDRNVFIFRHMVIQQNRPFNAGWRHVLLCHVCKHRTIRKVITLAGKFPFFLSPLSYQ